MTSDDEDREWLRESGAPEEYMDAMMQAISHMKGTVNQHPPVTDDRKELLLQAFESSMMEFILEGLMQPILLLTLTPVEQIELMRRIVEDFGHVYDAMALFLQPIEKEREDEA